MWVVHLVFYWAVTMVVLKVEHLVTETADLMVGMSAENWV